MDGRPSSGGSLPSTCCQQTRGVTQSGQFVPAATHRWHLLRPVTESLLWRRLALAPLAIAVCVYCIVAVCDDYGLQGLVTPALTLAVAASPLVAWLLARSERRHTFGDTSDTGKRDVIAAVGVVLVAAVVTRVLVGTLVVLECGLALVTGMAIAAAWKLWRGTYRTERTTAPGG